VRAALGLLALLVFGSAAGATAQTTRVTTYRPFTDGKPTPGFVVARAAKGSCFSGSLADPRSDAWRCFIGNAIQDPCFSDVRARSWVACPVDGTPFGKRIVRLSLTNPLPKGLANRGAPGQSNPWAVKLAGGTVCTFLTGATFAYHGKRVNYGCTPTIFLAGSPNRSKPTWTITLGTGPKAKPRTAVILVAAW
jgi:hypothetical protein